MAFTFDATTDRGKVRLLVGDTDTVTAANQIFTDTEIDALLALENQDVFAAAAAACQSIAASSARSAIAHRALDQSFDLRDVPKHYRALAGEFRERSRSGAPAEEIDAFDIDIGVYGVDRSEFVGDTLWS